MAALPESETPQFRQMLPGHLDAVLANEWAAYEFPWTRGVFEDCLRAGHECCVLARGDALIGHGVLSAAAGEAHVLNVCVAPVEQGHGHGRRILARLLQLARWHRSERVFLEVRPSNPQAMHLYHSMGFNEIGRRPGYYPARGGREDAVVMAIELL